MEKLKKSKKIVDIYSHCGISVIVQFIHGPSIENMVYNIDHTEEVFDHLVNENDTSFDTIERERSLKNYQMVEAKRRLSLNSENSDTDDAKEYYYTSNNNFHEGWYEDEHTLTPTQKLEIAFQMATAIAELHGFEVSKPHMFYN